MKFGLVPTFGYHFLCVMDFLLCIHFVIFMDKNFIGLAITSTCVFKQNSYYAHLPPLQCIMY